MTAATATTSTAATMGRRISVVGLGRLGTPLVAVLADAGHEVVGVDVDKRAVELVNAGRSPIVEPLLDELLTKNRARVRATLDAREAVLASEVTYVITPTPSLADGSFTVATVIAAVEAIGRALRDKSGRHLVVIGSTVLPESTSGPIRAALEREAQRAVGDALGLCYQPQFIALGSVVENMRKPDLVLIGDCSHGDGTHESWAGALLEEISRTFQAASARYYRMRPVNAEIAKLSVNAFVTMKISFANMLAELCEAIPGADVDVVTSAVGSDSRIGARYLRGGLPFGGPCFPRDNAALASVARTKAVAHPLPLATDTTNQHQLARLADVVAQHAQKGARVAVLGLAYKQDTNVVEQSPGVFLCQELAQRGFSVRGYDPLANEQARAQGIAIAGSLAACIDDVDVIVVTTTAAEFRALPIAAEAKRALVLVDGWGAVSPDSLPARVEYVRLGRRAP